MCGNLFLLGKELADWADEDKAYLLERFQNLISLLQPIYDGMPTGSGGQGGGNATRQLKRDASVSSLAHCLTQVRKNAGEAIGCLPSALRERILREGKSN